ncbi:MAG: methylenetetrahydrofolate reductase [Acidimicrobiia bacterium]|nr:methylenetetrahydrofolate reductase [Acidimicrobiia bacterium]
MLNRSRITSHESSADAEHRRNLIANLTFEVVPLSSLDAAIEALPPASKVSVTCSPVKGIAATMELTEQIRNLGHEAIPHIAARMVESKPHVTEIANWLRTEQIGRMFLVGGDADPPHGPYAAAVDFLADLLDAGPELHTVGVTSYPDGHVAIAGDALHRALIRKQQVLAEAGVRGYASTQMCFNPNRIVSWIEQERANGMDLPIHLGIPGVIDRAKLMTMGARLGIGASLGYLKKNRRAITKLVTMTHYDPNDLLEPLSPHLTRLDVEDLHCFTFNQVEATEAWRQTHLD